MPYWLAPHSAKQGTCAQQCTLMGSVGTGWPLLRPRIVTKPVFPPAVLRGKDPVSGFCCHSHARYSPVATSAPYHGTPRLPHVRPQGPSSRFLGIARASAPRTRDAAPRAHHLSHIIKWQRPERARERRGRWERPGGTGKYDIVTARGNYALWNCKNGKGILICGNDVVIMVGMGYDST